MFRLSSGTPCLVSMCVCKRERERERSFVKEREKLWCGSCAVWMFRPSSAAGQDVSSFVRHPVFSLCVCVCSVCVCKGGGEGERERERERDKSFIQEREKLWCGSCAVWMFRPSSAAGQDVSSFVWHPVFCECVSVRERERERALYKREKSFGVSPMMSGCFVHHRQPVKVLSGTSC